MKNPLEYQTVATIDAFFTSSEPIDADFGIIYGIEGGGKVLYASTATWNSQPEIVAKQGYIYIYSDYRQNDEGQNIPGFKVGDGNSYLIDLPFSDSLLDDQLKAHIEDQTRHITQQEREFWNNKVRCYIMDDGSSENLIFTKE